MKTFNLLTFLVPLVASYAQTASPTGPAYFTVYNVSSYPGSQQFTIQITNPTIIQQARAMLNLPLDERESVSGIVVKAPAYFNTPWSFHLDPASIGFFAASAEACDAATTEVEEHLDEVGTHFLPDNVWCPWQSKLLAEIPEPSGAQTYLRIASAASDSEAAISPGALISVYGQMLTDSTAEAGSSGPAPMLAGVTLALKAQSESNTRQISILFASPGQVNGLLPGDLPPGPVSVSLTNAAGQTFQAASYVETVAPGLFFIPQGNVNYAAATLQRVHPDGSSTVESLIATDPVSGQPTPVPIDFGNSSDQLYLSLYGTGFGQTTADTLSLLLAAEATPVLYVGPQGQVNGLDQLNIPLSQELRTQPYLELRPNIKRPDDLSIRSNAVRVLIQNSSN